MLIKDSYLFHLHLNWDQVEWRTLQGSLSRVPNATHPTPTPRAVLADGSAHTARVRPSLIHGPCSREIRVDPPRSGSEPPGSSKIRSDQARSNRIRSAPHRAPCQPYPSQVSVPTPPRSEKISSSVSQQRAASSTSSSPVTRMHSSSSAPVGRHCSA